MRLVQNFHEAPGPEAMAKSVLDALGREDYDLAVPLACHAAHNCAKNAFFEINALCATTLAKAGNAEEALEYWDRIIRSAPHKLIYLEAGIATAWQCASEISKKPLDNWLKLLERVYINLPEARFLSMLSSKGWQGEGSVGIYEGRIKGWVWSAAKPRLLVESSTPFPFAMCLEPVARAGERILYKLDAPLPETSATFKINVLANGHIQGSPITVSPAGIKGANKASRDKTLAIIIPVYGDYQATLCCIGSALASLRKNITPVRVIVAWDCGPDAQLLDKLRKLAGRSKIELIENPHNLGFLASVNGVLAQIGGDAILLNADTLVYGNWIDRLANAASRPDTATVTALGNEAELMSYPTYSDRGMISTLRQVKILDQAAASLDCEKAVQELPVGVGFCMYITARALRAIGGLDGRFLFRGYGEEVDYCLRASEAGMKNFGAFNVFIGHLGEKSFGIGKKALAAQNNDAIFNKFPRYRRDYEIFLAKTEPRLLREAISRNAMRAIAFAGELELRPWSERYLPPWIRDTNYQPDKKGGALFVQSGKNPRGLLRIWQDIPLADVRFDLRDEMSELVAVLRELGITNARARLKTEFLRKLAKPLGLELSELAAMPELPELPDVLPEAILTAPPPSIADWRSLLSLANKHPQSNLYVFQLGSVWANAPRPGNVHELPLMDNYRPLRFRDCLLWDGSDVDGWQTWLASHSCPDISFVRLGKHV